MRYMALPLSFRWPEEFVAQIDKVRGDVPRSAFVRRAVDEHLTRIALGEEGAAAQDRMATVEAASGGKEPTSPVPPRAAATSAPVNYAMERQRKLNDAKYGRRS